MAERIEVELVDDIDGSPAQHTVTFALDGATYEIDLSERHAKELRSLFARYIERSRSKEQGTSRDVREQERQERETRQVNKQLTEQIRGAAQRTRERLNKKTEQEEAAPSEEASERTTEETAPPLALEEPKQEKEPHEAKQDSGSVAAVSLPQFSSAAD